MGYSMKDLENAGRKLNERMEERSNQKGEELANKVINSTSQGRGLWFIILWPAWILICIFSGVFITGVLEKFGFGSPLTWLGLLGGIAVSITWYKSEFTIRHPFWSSVFGYFGTAFLVVLLGDKFGISI